MKKLIPLAALSATVLFLGACATPSAQQPTHYWAAQQPVSQSAYLEDNNSCQSASGFSGVGATRSDSYQAYQACMTHAGYRLVASQREDWRYIR